MTSTVLAWPLCITAAEIIYEGYYHPTETTSNNLIIYIYKPVGTETKISANKKMNEHKIG
jgi:hypothetical protein